MNIMKKIIVNNMDDLYDFELKIGKNRDCYSLKEGIDRINELLGTNITLKNFDISVDYYGDGIIFDLDLFLKGKDTLGDDTEELITYTLMNEEDEYEELRELFSRCVDYNHENDIKNFFNKVKGYWQIPDLL